ncbi:MAG: DUF4345 family protein [Planctomycetes bacterium]|nr:DUF4345 family protein [Planctomycetota bacterium]
MNTSRIAFVLIALNGLIALGFGLLGLAYPQETAESVSLEPQNAFGFGEIRALYGGMWAAMGLLLLGSLRPLATQPHSPHTERVRTIGLCWLGLPLGRGLGAVMQGTEGGPTIAFLLAEVVMVVTLLTGLTLLQRART